MRPYRMLCGAVLLQVLGFAIGLSFPNGTVPAGAIVLAALLPVVELWVGRRHVRVAFWAVLVIELIGAVTQFIPPIKLWRLGLVVLNALAVAICVRALRTDSAGARAG